MTTFQAIVYAILHGFAEFLPISVKAHDQLIPYLVDWPAPTGALSGALSFGAFLSVLVYFRHDWSSIVSCFLQVILFRKKPMTLDEKLPLFLTLTSLPPAIAWYHFRGSLEQFQWTPALVAALLALFSIPLLVAENFSRRNKGLFDLNWLDALLMGLAEIASFIPGSGRFTTLIPVALLRNYGREAAAKYGMYAALPFLGGSSLYWLRDVDFQAARPMADLSWLSFSTAVAVTFLTGLLAIGGLMKNLQSRGFGHYVAYRMLLATVAAVVIWWRS